jgi:hypothetical protein
MFTLMSIPNVLVRRSIIDDARVGDLRSPYGQRCVGLAEQRELLIEAPVVKDVAHDDHVRGRQRVGEEVAGVEAEAVTYSSKTGPTGGKSNPPSPNCRIASGFSCSSISPPFPNHSLPMAIVITRQADGLYLAELTPPHGGKCLGVPALRFRRTTSSRRCSTEGVTRRTR